MPIAGSNPISRRDAHVRWAERYARQNNMRKAIAHFGRALEFGNDGHHITVAIYISRATASAARRAWYEKDGGANPLLMSAMRPPSDRDSKQMIKDVRNDVAQKLQKSGVVSTLPTVSIEFYEAAEDRADRGDSEDQSGSSAIEVRAPGVYLEVRPSHGSVVTASELDLIKNGIMTILPTLGAGVGEHDVRSIRNLPAHEYTMLITLLWTGENVDGAVWQSNVSGKIQQYLEKNGLNVRVLPIDKIRKRKSTENYPVMQIHVRRADHMEIPDEKADELSQKIESLLDGIKRLLRFVVVVLEGEIEIQFPMQ